MSAGPLHEAGLNTSPVTLSMKACTQLSSWMILKYLRPALIENLAWSPLGYLRL